MLPKDEFLIYEQQLHPAFAGYLHDGEITKRDALAVIFHFISKGIIEPKYQDGDMRKRIIAVRQTPKKPKFGFEQKILDLLFKSGEEVKSEEVGKLIKEGKIQQIIKDNLDVIKNFQIEKLSVGYQMNTDLYDHPYKYISNFKQIWKEYWSIILTFTISTMIVFIALFGYIAGWKSLLFERDGQLFLTGLFILTFIVAYYHHPLNLARVLKYFFKNQPPLKTMQKYRELYEFLKNLPMPEHRITNEFLSFRIAFGIDNSWQKDFDLDEETILNETPIAQNY